MTEPFEVHTNLRGRKPTPPMLRVLTGDTTHRPPRNTPKPPLGPIECPAWLDDDAKAEWTLLAPELERIGLLTPLDAGTFAIYCGTYSTWKKADREIAEHGYIQTSKRGTLTTSPWVRIRHQQAELVRSLASEFGMTPSARTRISITPTVDDVSDGILT